MFEEKKYFPEPQQHLDGLLAVGCSCWAIVLPAFEVVRVCIIPYINPVSISFSIFFSI